MKLIILAGTANSGKSTTFRKLYTNFIKGNTDFLIKSTFDENMADYQTIVEYKGYRVCIYSWGDNLDNVKGGMDYAAKNNCDILICASRTKGDGHEELKRCKCPQIWIEKARFWTTNALSNEDKTKFYNEIATKAARSIYHSLQLFCDQ